MIPTSEDMVAEVLMLSASGKYWPKILCQVSHDLTVIRPLRHAVVIDYLKFRFVNKSSHSIAIPGLFRLPNMLRTH